MGENRSDHAWRKNQDFFLMKMNDMELLSDEITLLFSGKEGKEISNFISSYEAMIKSVRNYELGMDSIREQSERTKENFDKLSKVFKMEAKKERLYEQYNLLCEMHKNIKENKYIDELYKQIKFTK